MAKGIVSGILLVLLLAVLGYQRFGVHIDNPRKAIQAGIDNVKQNRSLTPEEEQYLRVQLAIVDYSTKNLRPPDALTDLIPVYFDTLPVDPRTKQPYTYVREGNRYRLGTVEQVPHGKSTTGKSAASSSPGTSVKSDTPFVDEPLEEQFLYDPADKRDPFRPFDLSGRVENQDPNRTPLETYELSQLRLTATALDASGNPTGMVEDQSGKGYIVKVGTKIGSNGGVVIAIEGQLMRVLERKVDFTGVETENIVEMKLQAGIDDQKKNSRKPKKKQR